MWISHQTIGSRVRLRETVPSERHAGHRSVLHFKGGHAWPRGPGSQAGTAGIVVHSKMEGVCVCLECVCRCDRVSLLCKTTISFGMTLLVKHNNKLGSMGDQASNSKWRGMIQDKLLRSPKPKPNWINQANKNPEVKTKKEERGNKRQTLTFLHAANLHGLWGDFSIWTTKTGSPFPGSEDRLWARLFGNWRENRKFWVYSENFRAWFFPSSFFPRGKTYELRVFFENYLHVRLRVISHFKLYLFSGKTSGAEPACYSIIKI